MIGADMIADLCIVRGWDVDFLGPNVPAQAIIEMVQPDRLLSADG